MILKQHLDINGLSFDIAIRKPPPVDEAGGKELDGWMRAIVSMIREISEMGGEFGVWDDPLPRLPLRTQLVHFRLKNMGPGQPRGNFEVEV